MDPLQRSETISQEYKEIREDETWRRTLVLSFQSLGIVFGRLSTSPLYVFGSIHPGDLKSEEEIYELFSFIFWTLTIVPLLKYAFIILRADDDGEVPYISNDQRYLIGRVGPREYKIYRCVVLHGYRDNIRDSDAFEDHIVSSIGEFIAREKHETSPDRMMILGETMGHGSSALIPLSVSSDHPTYVGNNARSTMLRDSGESSSIPASRKRVRFTLPESSPQMNESVRQELQDLVDARESGTILLISEKRLKFLQEICRHYVCFSEPKL